MKISCFLETNPYFHKCEDFTPSNSYYDGVGVRFHENMGEWRLYRVKSDIMQCRLTTSIERKCARLAFSAFNSPPRPCHSVTPKAIIPRELTFGPPSDGRCFRLSLKELDHFPDSLGFDFGLLPSVSDRSLFHGALYLYRWVPVV